MEHAALVLINKILCCGSDTGKPFEANNDDAAPDAGLLSVAWPSGHSDGWSPINASTRTVGSLIGAGISVEMV